MQNVLQTVDVLEQVLQLAFCPDSAIVLSSDAQGVVCAHVLDDHPQVIETTLARAKRNNLKVDDGVHADLHCKSGANEVCR